MTQSTTESVAFGSGGQRVALVLIGSLFCLIGVSVLATDQSVGGIAIGAVVGVAGGLFAYRGARAGVRADAWGITHRSLERTRRIPWCRIREIASGPAGGSSPMPTGAPTLTLDDGRTHALTGMASSTITERSQSMVATRCQKLRDLHAHHRASCETC